MKARPRTHCDGVSLPALEAVLCDPHGITWRVISRDESAEITVTGGLDFKRRVTAAQVAGWEVLP